MPPDIFEVAIYTDFVEAYNLVMPSGLDRDLKRVTPASLARILRTIAAFENVQRELGPSDRHDWSYHFGMSMLAAALHSAEPETIADWFRQIGSFAKHP
jgi:hypothetical protein